MRGYVYVGLNDGSKTKTFGVHRVVALTFIPNPDNKPQVNHIDHNPSNNKIENLEWVTKSENITHSWLNKNRKQQRPLSKVFLKPVNQLLEETKNKVA